MKAFTKISSVLIIATAAFAFAPGISQANDAGLKRGGLEYKGPPVSLFATSKTTAKPVMTCELCKPEFVAAVTQDTKLKAKTILLEQHACKGCKTVIARIGAQKATGKDIAQHSCGGRLVASVETCCKSMPDGK